MAFERNTPTGKVTIKASDYADFTEQDLINNSGSFPKHFLEYEAQEEVIIEPAVYDPDPDVIEPITPAVTELQTVTKWRFMDNAELKAAIAQAELDEEPQHINNLQNMCEIYQKQSGCNGNFFAMLTAVRGVAKSTGQPIPTKAQACLDWLDDLWKIYYTRKANKDWNHDFSEAGTIPHSFTEVREESEQ
jgi:hypothetical protein